jgi:CRISPR/Cas system-associated exonuclease Cas4 (RecB family)
MATRRTGKSYIWVTWLAKLLGGDECLWSAWFKSHFKYDKVAEEEGEQLVEWNRNHSRMMRERRAELEEMGWSVAVEAQNEFKLEGETAIVAGKPDLLATLADAQGVKLEALVIDGKTGRERDSDRWQVLIYLYALVRLRKDLPKKLAGEVHYKTSDRRIPVRLTDLTPARVDDIVKMVKVIAGDNPPAKAPSRQECRRCNIGPADCPDRFKERTAPVDAAVAGF